ncbi:MAG: Ig-like domain repeat protein, partial [Janthinobacterium lividum]
ESGNNELSGFIEVAGRTKCAGRQHRSGKVGPDRFTTILETPVFFATRRVLPLLLLLLFASPLYAQTNFTSVVVFGDSLSDTGNVANLVQAATGGLVRYPSDVLLKFDYTDGRFTDGTDTQPAASAYLGVWIEQLAASFPAKPAVKNSLNGGTNFAYGDATTATPSTTVTEGPISITIHNMGQQVTDYLGSSPAPIPNATTLYVLWGGSNDVLQAVGAKADPVAAAGVAVNNELKLVQQLVNAGATNFIVPNIPPLGSTPEGATSGAGTALNNASIAFAQQLAMGLGSIKQTSAAAGVTLNIYQPDILTLFAQDATYPMSVGFGNVSAAAQNTTGDPDAYLIWDGLHPTTTGHHFVAAAAVDLLTTRATSSIAIAVPAAIISGQATTATAKVTATGSGPIPTGLVTFYAETAAVGSATLDATGTATLAYTGTPATGGPYNISATYAGDTANKVSLSAGTPLTVIGSAISTVTTLTTSNGSPNVGGSVVLTATVTPAVSTYGAPAGTVTFLNGTTTLGTAPVTNGVATFTTTSLTGTLSITASYAANGVFGASVSGAVAEIVVTPGFTATANPTTLAITDGGSGTTMLSATGVGGFSGPLTLACGTLPAHISCSFSATTLTVPQTGSATAITLTIATNATASLARPDRPGAFSAPVVLSATLLFPGVALATLFGLRRRKVSGIWLTALLVLLASGATFGLAGCGSNSTNNASRGTYTVPVTFTPATGTAQTVNLSVTVQ